MGAWRTISVALTANSAGYTRAMGTASAATRKFDQEQKRVTDASASRWSKFSKVAVGGLAVLTMALGASIGEAISWESAFAGVAKTVDATDSEIRSLEKGLIDMSLRLPATRAEIAGVAEAAGALGIATPFIEDFTEVMIGLGEATNLTADEAATQLAQFANIMGTSQDQFEDLADTLVHLGNNGASTEREILQLSLRLAGAGQVVGLTENEVMALANAMASMGVPAELGGGAFSRIMRKIEDSVMSGTDKVGKFGEVAGMSAEEFTEAWQTDPAAAIEALVGGLARIQGEGGNVIGTLRELGIKASQESDVILRMLGGVEGLKQSFIDAEEASGALATETEKRYATAAAKLEVLRNQVTNVGRVVGSALIPSVLAGVEAIQSLGRWGADVASDLGSRLSGAWRDLVQAGDDLVEVLESVWGVAGPTAELLAKLGAGAVIGGITGLATILGSVLGLLADNEGAVEALTTALIVLAGVKATGMLIDGFDRLSVRIFDSAGAVDRSQFAQKLGLVGSGFRDMAGAGVGAFKNVDNYNGRFRGGLAKTREGVRGLTSGLSNAGIVGGLAFGSLIGLATSFRDASAKAKADLEALQPAGYDPTDLTSVTEYLSALQAQKEAILENHHAHDGFFNNVRGGFETTIGAVFGMKSGTVEANEALKEHAALLEEVGGQASAMTSTYREIARLTGLTVDQVKEWAERLEIDVMSDSQQGIAAAILAGKDAADEATPSIEGAAAAMEVLGSETATATEELDAWKDAIDEIIGVEIGVAQATLDWTMKIQEMSAALKENGTSMDIHTEQGQKNKQMAIDLAEQAIATSEAIAERDGVDAGVAALERYRQEMIEAWIAAGLNEQAARDLAAELGLIPSDIRSTVTVDQEGALNAARTVRIALDDLERTRIARINVIMGQIQGATGLSTGQLFGNRWGAVHEYARGGIHGAHIGRGDLIRYAEPETEMEAYIPKRGDDRRSLGILGEAASWFGMAVVPKAKFGMAAGGILGSRIPHHSYAATTNTQTTTIEATFHVTGVDGSSSASRIWGAIEADPGRLVKTLVRHDRSHR